MNAELHEMTRDELVEAVLSLTHLLECERRVSRTFQSEARGWQGHCDTLRRANKALIARVRTAEARADALAARLAGENPAPVDLPDPFGLIDAANDAARRLGS